METKYVSYGYAGKSVSNERGCKPRPTWKNSNSKITMRLTTQERQIIKSSVKEVMGSQANVWLFGSRVDDTKRGGDIDLFVEVDLQNPLDRVQKKSRLWAKLQQQLGEQRIDIILASIKSTEQRRIEQVAKESGVCL